MASFGAPPTLNRAISSLSSVHAAAAAAASSSSSTNNSHIHPPSSSSPPPTSSITSYVDHLLTISIVQLCEAAGYSSAQSSALAVLTDILYQYIQEIGIAAKSYAELSNRQQPHLFDVVAALEDYQQDLPTLMEYRHQSDQLPFLLPYLPPWPVKRPIYVNDPGLPQDAVSKNKSRCPGHIPSFLPPFPPPHTYKHTPSIEQTIIDPTTLRKTKLEQSHKSFDSLGKLEQQREHLLKAAANQHTAAATQTFGLIQEETPSLQLSASVTASPLVPPSVPSGAADQGQLQLRNQFTQPVLEGPPPRKEPSLSLTSTHAAAPSAAAPSATTLSPSSLSLLSAGATASTGSTSASTITPPTAPSAPGNSMVKEENEEKEEQDLEIEI